ncbi:SRPBCC domain-containing protein [Novosphingobium album (ex Liu et al. 2023)]|uniref:SRPBCC domain-containing protein n=1 Tax=Novosphingobium album (ex Liu et al. 2023) TaxID=3031130 RepID=A0ABT5WJM3_9SPHN|nr:SRPBCC domain-containing protein [Novosphingobium album (ex Liu et al. 2023)]MDE8650245.1 SRPBCC domain-containing protein [Novosphingobium album (ex Liu et al. 2023)]
MTAPPRDDDDFAGAGAAPGRIKGRCVGHRVTIEAPPELVWDFIADFEGWGSWNPLYTQTAGAAEPGATIRFTVAVPGLKPHKGSAEVYAVRQNELLEYGVSSLGGMLKALRFVELDEISPTRCAVANAEIMGGPVGLLLSRTVGERVRQGLEAMNLALKAVAERKWRGRPA